MKCRLFSFLILAVSLALGSLTAAAQTAETSLWWALAQAAFDPNRVAVVERIEIRRDAATLTLVSGQLAVTPLWAGPPAAGEERLAIAAFRGSGRLRFAPTLPLEKQQLAFHSGQSVLDAEFTEAVFILADNTLKELSEQLAFRPGDTSEFQNLYRDRRGFWTKYGLNWEPRLLKNLLAETPAAHAFFLAEMNTKKYDWLTLIVDQADPEQMELAHWYGAWQRLDIWSKFPANSRTPQEAFADPVAHHEYIIKRYTLDVTVHPNTELEGKAQVEFDLRRGGERVLLFTLDPNLRVSEVRDGAGRTLAFFQPEDPKNRSFFYGDYLVVAAAEPLAAGTHSLHFRYAGKRVVRKEGAGTFFCRSFGWYPSYGVGRVSLTTNEFAARSDFDVTLRVPKKYLAVAVGTKVEERQEGDFRVTRWLSDIPLAVAGFAFGNYKVQTVAAGAAQVEVYANKNPDELLRFIEMTAGGDTDVPTDAHATDIRNPTAALGSLSPSRLAEEMAVEVSNSLRLFERYFGPYPYKKLAVANIPALYSYGQGWPGLLYIWAISFLDSTQRHELGISDHVQLTDYFRAHETSHQWWGHAVGWKSYHDQWLSEGFADYSGILYTLYRRNPQEHFRLLRNHREFLLARDGAGTVYDEIGPIYAGFRLSSGNHRDAYSNVVYNKGGWVLHMLRMMLYDPRNRENPDARFSDMMQDFTKTYFNRAASTEDFQRIVEKHMTPAMNLDGNGRMNWFFDSWVYGTGIPAYTLEYKVEPTAPAGQFLLSGVLRQSGVPENFRMLVPLYLHQGEQFVRAGWLNVRGPTTSFQVTLPFKPDKVSLNEWEDVLCTVEYK